MRLLPDTYQARDPSVVQLVHLRTYSDRDAGTVEADFWFASGKGVLYPWNAGPVTTFEPHIVRLGAVQESMDTIPTQRASAGNNPFRETWQVTLSNSPYGPLDGVDLWDVLRETNLDFAQIEFAALEVTGEDWTDLRNLGGTEHIVWHRGSVSRYATQRQGAEIVIQSRVDEPRFPWLRALDTTEPAIEDVGTLYPIVIGNGEKIRAVKRVAGIETTLGETLAQAETGTKRLTSVRGLPDIGSYFLRINGEEVEATAKDSINNTVQIIARGLSGTADVPHQLGESVIELTDTKLVLAGHPAAQLRSLYLRNPYDGRLFALDPSSYTFNLADDTLEPGRLLTTVEITQEALRTLLASLQVQARVNVQPEFVDTSTPGGGSGTTPVAPGNGYSLINFNAWDRIDGLPMPVTMRKVNSSAPVTEAPRAHFASGDVTGVSGAVRFRIRARATVTVIEEVEKAGVTLEWRNIPGMPDGAATASTGSQGSAVTAVSPWASPASMTDSANGSSSGSRAWARGYTSYNGPNPQVRVDAVELEVDFDTTGGGPGTIARVVDTQIEAASVGVGLEFFADIDGGFIPVEYSLAYGFEDDPAGNTVADGGSVTQDTSVFSEGAASWRLDRAGSVLKASCDDLTGWTLEPGLVLTVETTPTAGGMPTQGTGYFEITGDGGSRDAQFDLPASEDWSAPNTVFAVDLELDQDAIDELNNDDGIRLRIFDSGGDEHEERIGQNQLPAGYTAGDVFTFEMVPGVEVNGSVDGNFDANDVTGWILDKRGSVDPPFVIRVDNFRLKGGGLKASVAVPSFDSTSVGLAYRFDLQASEPADVTGVRVWFSSDAQVDENRPGNYFLCTFSGQSLGDGTWRELVTQAAETGNVIETAIIQFGFEVDYVGDQAPAIWIDRMQRAGADFDVAYPFDDDTGWTADNCSVSLAASLPAVPGSAGSLRIERTAVSSTAINCDALSDAGGTWSLLSNDSRHEIGIDTATAGDMPVEGTGCVYLDRNNGANGVDTVMEYLFTSQDDVTGQSADFALMGDSEMVRNLSPYHGIELRVRDAAGNKLVRYVGSETLFLDYLTERVRLSLSDEPEPGTGYQDPGYNPAQAVALEAAILADQRRRSVLWVDDIRVEESVATLQRSTTAGTVDLSGDYHRVYIAANKPETIDAVVLTFSNESVAYPGVPSTIRRMWIPANQLSIEFRAFTAPLTGLDPADDVETIRIDILYKTDELSLVWVDWLEGSQRQDGWIGDGGSVATTVPDAFLWILDQCGVFDQGDTIDVDSFLHAAINTVGMEVRGDLRALGLTFQEIVQALAFETRSQLTFRHGRLGRVWRLLTPRADNSFEVTDAKPIDGTGFDESNRDVSEAGTDFSALYQYDASASFDEGAFAGLVRADAGLNETNVEDVQLTLARRRLGERAIEPFTFLMVQDSVTASAALGWIVHEATRLDRRRFPGVLPAWDGLALEIGDVRLSEYYGSSRGFRVVSRSINPETGMVTVTFEEIRLWDGR